MLSTLVLEGNTSQFVTPLGIRSKIEQHWADLRALRISEDKATQDMHDFMTQLGFDIPDKEDVWQTALYYKGNAKLCNINAFSYEMYLSAMANYINVDRKGRGWETDMELFNMQNSKHLQEKINIPILNAIKNNDLVCLRNMLNDLERNQYFYDEKRKVALFKMHIEWLRAAKRQQRKKAFYALKPVEFCFDGSERYCTRCISDWATARDTMDYDEIIPNCENILFNEDLARETAAASKSFIYSMAQKMQKKNYLEGILLFQEQKKLAKEKAETQEKLKKSNADLARWKEFWGCMLLGYVATMSVIMYKLAQPYRYLTKA